MYGPPAAALGSPVTFTASISGCSIIKSLVPFQSTVLRLNLDI